MCDMVGLGWYAWLAVCLLWWIFSVEVTAQLPDDLLTTTVLMTLQYSFMLLFIISAAHLYHNLLPHPTHGIIGKGLS